MVKVLLRWMVVACWMGVIFALSAIPSLASPSSPFYDFMLRKLAHVTIYAVLTMFLVRAFRLHVASSNHAWLLAGLVAGLYAISDEWHQTFVPGREGTVRDVAIDGVGVLGACILSSLLRGKETWRR